jgi:uncharacterized cupredoxin-like copper-binding protein
MCQIFQFIGILFTAFIYAFHPVAIAAPMPSVDLVTQTAIEVKVSLSNLNNELKFEPDRFVFETGKRYKLVLSNPSAMKHYFTSKDFADAIWTQKVEAGNVEIKGHIRELELRPQATAAWYFVPIKQGSYSLRCPIAGHSEAGMKGTIVVQ